ncbi:MAG: hypothetical protein WC028_06220 [Candidatus Obscuribacterales bacterium]
MIKPAARNFRRTLARNTFRPAIFLLATALITACGAYTEADLKADKKRFPALSRERVVGSKCSVKDSASIRRVAAHPLGPTGGWNLYGRENSQVDYSRSKQLEANCLVFGHGGISGYVKFDKPGYLQARSYDDVYGDVYCGWSPEKLSIKPTKDYVYVSLGTCSVGDGGLEQVHEVSWFPQGQQEGIIVFSSAHPDKPSPLTAADLYRPDLLGNEYQFDDSLAAKAIADYLRQGNLQKADEVITASLTLLSKMRDSVDGTTRKPIAAKEIHQEQWAMIQTFRLGLALGEPTFDSRLEDLKATINGPHRGSYRECDTYKKLFPIYKWLNKKVTEKITNETNQIDISKLERGLVDHEPDTIGQFLLGKTSADDFRQRSRGSAEFWLGVNHYLQGDKKTAKENFQKFLEQDNSDLSAFEIAAAAKLRASGEQPK